jgi:uncharacterized membrane protein YozB (DUF420 family)
MDVTHLPLLNACLNALSACLLTVGYVAIRRGNRIAHQRCMVSAVATSTLFLISYLVYHALVGSTRFTGQGWIRPVYFAILISHTVLATAIVPLVLGTVYLAWRQRFEQHRRLARWTFPLWLYVSLTGVLIYLLLYRLYPALPS